jgi:hypothetical protein
MIYQTCNNLHRNRLSQFSISAKRRDSKSDDDGENSGPGMEAAFRELEGLKSLDGDDDSSSGGIPPPMKKEQDEAFAKAIESLNLKDYVEVTNPPTTLEKEVKVYQDMVSELEKTNENELYSDLLSDMGGSGNSKISKSIPSLASLIPNLSDGTSAQDTQKFMDKALEEALMEAEEKAENIDKSTVLDNKEIMKEIEAIFDNANKKLLDGLEEIRSEQVRFPLIFVKSLRYNDSGT